MIAWVALGLWPVVCIFLYQRTSLPAALCITILGGYLLLPSLTSFDPPLLPPLDKTTIPTLTALVLTAFALGRQNQPYPVLPGWLPRNPIVVGLFVVLVIGAFGSALTNSDPQFYGPIFLPGLQIYDAFSILLELLVVIIPLLLARRVLASPEAQRVFLGILVISAVLYCLPALYEVRMSPQLHHKIYGFFPSSFVQAMRGGGFRPNVFLNHGLALSIFLTLALLAALGLFRMSTGAMRNRWAAAAGLIVITLVLSKSLGALIIALIFMPIVLFLQPRTQLLAAVTIAGIVITYPMLRMADLFPIEQIMSWMQSISPERADSLMFRVLNENALLEKARERAAFGWGGWSRNFVFDAQGNIQSITDGAWIIAFGEGGWLRYFSIFGLLCWSIMAFVFGKGKDFDATSGLLVLILAAKLVDLLPNAGLAPLHWLIAGALIGRFELRLREGEQSVNIPQPDADQRQAGGYTSAKKPPEAVARPVYARQFPQAKSRTAPPKKDTKPSERERASYIRGKPAPGSRS